MSCFAQVTDKNVKWQLLNFPYKALLVSNRELSEVLLEKLPEGSAGEKINLTVLDFLKDKDLIHSVNLSKASIYSCGQESDCWVAKDGVLWLCLSESTYRKAGLTGKRLENTSSYIVVYELDDLPAQVKAFERLCWSCENILQNCFSQSVRGYGLTRGHHKQAVFSSEVQNNIPIPSFVPHSAMDLHSQSGKEYFDEFIGATQEWLGLVALGSNRLTIEKPLETVFGNYSVRQERPDGTVSEVRSDCYVYKWSGEVLSPDFVTWFQDLVDTQLSGGADDSFVSALLVGRPDALLSWQKRISSCPGENSLATFRTAKERSIVVNLTMRSE